MLLAAGVGNMALDFLGGESGGSKRGQGNWCRVNGMLGNLWEEGYGKLETRSGLRHLNFVPSSLLSSVCPLFKNTEGRQPSNKVQNTNSSVFRNTLLY